MTSVCYLIVCVNFVYYFNYVKPYYAFKSLQDKKEEQALLIKLLNAENQDYYLAKTVSPYWNMTYADQLDRKQRRCIGIVDEIVNKAGRLKNMMSYKIIQIVPSPVTKAYRNLDKFHIACGIDGNPKTVGLILGTVRFGEIYSVSPKTIVTIKESHKRVAKDFIRSTPIPESYKLNFNGHWNILRVRSNEAGDVMVSVSVRSRGYTKDTIWKQQNVLKEYLVERLPNISLFHQVCQKERCSHYLSPYKYLSGKPHIMEKLSGYVYKIYPYTSFPNNKRGAEVMYDTVIRTAKLNTNTTVLDICSGTGMNSIIVSKFVKRVVGFESYSEALSDVKQIVYINNIHNVIFHVGRINDILKPELEKMNESSVVAILNHRQRGLESDAIQTIRRSAIITRLVYMFYKPNSVNAIQNFIDLCSVDNSTVLPFRLIKVIPIDMLPQTQFVEMILIFER